MDALKSFYESTQIHTFQAMPSKYQTTNMILVLETEASSQRMAPYDAANIFTQTSLAIAHILHSSV